MGLSQNGDAGFAFGVFFSIPAKRGTLNYRRTQTASGKEGSNFGHNLRFKGFAWGGFMESIPWATLKWNPVPSWQDRSAASERLLYKCPSVH